MTDATSLPEVPMTPPLSQGERVIDTFIAPSKTFTDVLRSASWWLPFVIVCVISYGLCFSIEKKVTWAGLVENTIHSQPKMEEKLSQVPPDRVEMQKKIMAASFRYPFYLSPVTNFIFVAVGALFYWLIINFMFGGRATYWQTFAVVTYGLLVGSLKTIVAIILLYAGNAAESFTMDAMVGSDPGYYIETPGALKVFLTSFDIFTLWMMAVMAIGLAIVARTKKSSGYITVFGLWALIVLLKTAWAAAFG